MEQSTSSILLDYIRNWEYSGDPKTGLLVVPFSGLVEPVQAQSRNLT